MEEKEILASVRKKKDFSKLPKRDILLAYEKFSRRQTSDAEKLRLTRELLHKVFGVFSSKKLLSLKDKDPEWILRKHVSTRERLGTYAELYAKLFKGFSGTVCDLGAGVNGFSFGFFPKGTEYVAIEAVGQLVDLMNYYFKTRGLQGWAIHESLFNLENIKQYVGQVKEKKMIFLFKVLDSLEMMGPDYSKKVLLELTPLAQRMVVSFATRSIGSRVKFRARRNWIVDFINNHFELLEDFELGSERYVVFERK